MTTETKPQAPLITRSEILADIRTAVHDEMKEQVVTQPALTAPQAPVQEAPTPTDDAKIVLQAPVQVAVEQMGPLGGIVSALDDVRLFDVSLPLGSAIIGLPSGVIVGEVIDGLVSPRTGDGGVNFMNLVAKGIGTWGILSFGKNLMGVKASQYAAAALLLQIASNVLPINEWVASIVGMVKGIGRPAAAETTQYSAVRQAEVIASQAARVSQMDHYRRAM